MTVTFLVIAALANLLAIAFAIAGWIYDWLNR